MSPKPLLGVLIATLLAATACGSSESEGSLDSASDSQSQSAGAEQSAEQQPEQTTTLEADTTETTLSQDATTTTEEPIDVGRVVVVAEEATLSDVLSLGIPVVASSATVPDVGFQGMEGIDVEGIEIFNYLSLSLEELAVYDADHIIVWEFLVGQVGEEQLAGLNATLHILPDGSSGRDRLRQLGEEFGRTETAEELIGELDATYEAGRGTLAQDCAATVVAIYPGPSPAVFVEPVWDVARAVTELGCELVPGSDKIEASSNGRAFISLEQLELLSGPEIIMLQTSTVEGEDAAVDEIKANGIWQLLPAVQAGRVFQLDRLGYAGLQGEIRLVGELIEILNS